MSTKKTKITALKTVSHGNLDMKEGRTYLMSTGEARELEKAGFVSLGGDGEPDGTMYEAEPMKPAPGDVVADDAADILGAKMDTAVENKMANATANKAAGKAGK